MIIEKIHIDCFGKLENRTLELNDRINIIEGENESGKSTYATFIKFIFYGLSTKSRDLLPSERDRYINWHTGTAGGYMIVRTHNGARFRIERTMVIAGQRATSDQARKSYREGLQVIDLSNNSPVSGIGSPGEYFFGVDEEIYTKTAFINQLSGARVDGEKLTQSIENILFSANESINISKAIKKLDTSRVALLHKNGGGGQIYELEQKKNELEAKLERAKQIGYDILEKESSLRAASEKQITESKKAEKLASQIASFENAAVVALFQKKHGCAQALDAAKSAYAAIKEKYTKDSFIPDQQYITELDAAKESYDQALIESNNIYALLEKAKRETHVPDSEKDMSEQKLKELENAKASCDRITARAHSVFIPAVIFSAIALILILTATAGMLLNLFENIAPVVLVSSLLPIILAAVLFIIRATMLSKKQRLLRLIGITSTDLLAGAIESARESARLVREADDRVTRLEQDYASAQARTQAAQSELEQKNCWAYSENVKDNIRSARDALRELENAENEIGRLNDTLVILDTQLAPFDEEQVLKFAETAEDISGIDAEMISEKRREYEFVSGALKALETRIHTLEKELASLYSIADNPARIAEKIELARAFIAEYSKKHSAYMLAIEKLEQASASMRDNISPKLADFTSKLMSELTQGKYTEIGIDGEFSVSVATDAGSRELGYLSAGTQDITYVSLRLALISSLFRSNLPSIIFDESFSRLDNQRLSQMLKLTDITGANMQIILLTSSPREAELMSSLCKDYGYIKLQ